MRSEEVAAVLTKKLFSLLCNTPPIFNLRCWSQKSTIRTDIIAIRAAHLITVVVRVILVYRFHVIRQLKLAAPGPGALATRATC